MTDQHFQRSIRVAGHQVRLPRSRRWRIGLGSALVVGGILGFLPILGFWMLPLGLFVLSIDLPIVRRRRRRLNVWWGRRRAAKSIHRKPKQ